MRTCLATVSSWGYVLGTPARWNWINTALHFTFTLSTLSLHSTYILPNLGIRLIYTVPTPNLHFTYFMPTVFQSESRDFPQSPQPPYPPPTVCVLHEDKLTNINKAFCTPYHTVFNVYYTISTVHCSLCLIESKGNFFLVLKLNLLDIWWY